MYQSIDVRLGNARQSIPLVTILRFNLLYFQYSQVTNMSDEDSFVILGSTPTASMEPFSMRSDFTPMSSLQPTGNALSLLQNETEAISPENQPFSILQYQDESEKAASISPYKSLAEQFIMGQIDVASLKVSN